MNIDQSLQKLFSLRQMGVKLGLENISKLLAYLNNPQDKFKSIHIAGSNGKGSTASFIASIIMEAGFKVGLFTSPHFVSFNERIRINGRKIEDEYIAEFINNLNSYIDNNEITFFEITTALAFQYFKDNNVDYAVVETGLGGRLDATNLLTPIVSVITSISLEHTRILGSSIEEVAGEKGGIIKNDSQLVLGKMPQEAENVLTDKARSINASVFSFSNFAEELDGKVKIRLDSSLLEITSTPLKGQHQLCNAAAAVFASKVLGISGNDEILKGIKNVIPNSGIKGRYEIYSEDPKIIFDAAHNPEGMKVFIDEFKNEVGHYKFRTAIFGAMSDKNLKEMIETFAPYFTKIFVAAIDFQRAASIRELTEIASEINIEVTPLENPSEYILNYKERKKGQCLAIFGSIYLIGDIKLKLSNKRA